MASLIPGYEYDIFISYRQKDNKGDKWVSRFVDALKTELESTFKEDISVYFDENPHDRLQETHNVDKSLEGKLKCLIFIPILSQTYCDPNSYAWQYEFLAFLSISENDHFGKDVRLRSGNVTSRILPIRIHDLEPEDVKLFEKETGSVLRALDFIFKTSTGVIRPLLTNEDHPNDNLNKTFYRDQITKVALAIKEIILAMKKEPEKVEKEKEKAKEVRTEEGILIPENPHKPLNLKFIRITSILAVLVIIAILFYPKFSKRDALENLSSSGKRISVAVMPFQNITSDSTWNVWQDGIKDELINYLTNYNEELEVRQVNSINELLESKGFNNYASITPSVAGTISKKLNAKVFIIGSIKQAGDKIRINAQIIDSNTEEAIKAFQIEGESKVSEILKITDSLKLLVKNYLIISIMKKEVSPVFQQYIGSTKSPEALRLFIDGQKAFMKREYSEARKMLLNALEIDSNYASPAIYLAVTYGNQNLFKEAKEWSLYAYKKRDRMSRIEKTFSDWVHAYYFNNTSEALKNLNKMLEIDDQQAGVYYNIGLHYNRFFQFDKAITEFEKSLDIFNKLEINPMWAYSYTALGYSYHKAGEFKKEKMLYKKADKIFPDDIALIYRHAVLALSEGNTKEANIYIEKYKSISKDNSASEAAISSNLAAIYNEADLPDEAEGFYRKALSSDPKNPARINNLAYFLIDKDRDVNEGLVLADTLLKIRPDYHSYLHSKGWGLYKRGKYKEALEALQKSWDIRLEKAIYNHEAFLHLEAAKKAVEGLK